MLPSLNSPNRTIGQDNSNVPNVIKLFADAFAKSSIEVNSVVGQRMVLILRHVQVSSFID